MRGTREVMHTGVGNGGIRTVAPAANRLTIRCSDGGSLSASVTSW